ncbi:MAG TPA: rhomboid family intramembrane serine protease [Spirochaetia bacterium]|nr:rhomboid family intramembrane serine protease [Spirochaetia bacterium]
MKIRYNAPVILTFSLASLAIFIVSRVIPEETYYSLFTVPGNNMPFNFFSLSSLRLVSYVLGHASWEHLIGNLSFILLIGPVLEEKYGSGRILIMILLTALVTGVFNVLFLSGPSLGASGIVFMLVLLISFTNVKKGEIPLTLIAVIAVFVTKEVFNMFQPNNINEEAHLVGGLCGGIFGFFFAREKKKFKESKAMPQDDLTVKW